MDYKALKICEKIIRTYMSIDNCPQELIDHFVSWLTNGRHCREKDIVMRRIFYEIMDVVEIENEVIE